MNNFLKVTRLDKPTLSLLLFYPCAFGILSNLKSKKDLLYIPIFLMGSIVMHSSCCIINDLFDINFDNKVERTKFRLLTSGKVSKNKALIWLILLLLPAIIVLGFLSPLGKILSIGAFILAIIYPLMKRITYFTQIFLGITCNTGILIGAATLKNTLSIADFIIYFGCIFWVMGFDTIYAFMDIKDDKKIGLKSLALLLLDKNYKIYLILFYSFFIISISINMSMQNILSIKSVIILLITYILLISEVVTLQINSMYNCSSRFNSNIIVGIMITLAYIIEKIVLIL